MTSYGKLFNDQSLLATCCVLIIVCVATSIEQKGHDLLHCSSADIFLCFLMHIAIKVLSSCVSCQHSLGILNYVT